MPGFNFAIIFFRPVAPAEKICYLLRELQILIEQNFDSKRNFFKDNNIINLVFCYFIITFVYSIRYYWLLYSSPACGRKKSVELLSDIIPNAGELLEMAKIDLFGNGRNWSKAWLILNDEQKLLLSAYVITHKF